MIFNQCDKSINHKAKHTHTSVLVWEKQTTQSPWRQNLDPVTIGILQKRKPFHIAIIRSFNIRHAKIIKPRASSIHIWNRNSDVTKSSRLIIAMVVAKIRIQLSTMIVG